MVDQAIETRALEIATNLRMEQGDGEAAFLEATRRCRFAHSQGDASTASLYQRAGSHLVELCGISLDRVAEILDPPAEAAGTVTLPTDLRGVIKDNATRRYACDHVGIQSDGKSTQAVATDGRVLAIVDEGMLHGEVHAPGEYLLDHGRLPRLIKDRAADLPSQDAASGQLPPLDGIVPSQDSLACQVTVNARYLRALLDAVCNVQNKDQEVTIGLQVNSGKPAVIATDQAIGVIMPVNVQGQINDRYDDRVNRAVALAQAAHSH
tara:strand:- start:750 stop:1544 length:795 start_codon:yes stop_codon:yes gene_type:complete